MTDDAMVKLFETNFKHIEKQLEDIDEKVDRIDKAIFGNSEDGLKTATALNTAFIRHMREEKVLTKVTENTTFRTDAKKVIFRLIGAAILSGGIGAGAVQGIIKLFG